MIVLGADTHKRSHTIAAVSAATGELMGEHTVQVEEVADRALRDPRRVEHARQDQPRPPEVGSLRIGWRNRRSIRSTPSKAPAATLRPSRSRARRCPPLHG